jgi:putative ABC transport system permease protein
MFLALKELKRAWVRFALLIIAIALLVFVILFQWTLRNGLLNAFTGAIRNQSAPILVYTVDGQRFLQASVIPPPLEAQIRSVEGIGRVGRVAQGTFTGAPVSSEPFDVSLIGLEVDGLGYPLTVVEGRQPNAPGEVIVSDVSEADGFRVGQSVTIQPGKLRLQIVGRASGVQLNVTPTLFGQYDTFLQAVTARNPDAQAPLPNALAIEPAAGVDAAELISRINALGEDVDALTRDQAADLAPGVAQVKTSFWIVFFLFGIVVPLVAGLFFIIVTFQKAGSMTLLRAIGAPASRLIASLLIQVMIVMGLAIGVGCALYAAFTRVGVLGGIPVVYEGAAVTGWTILLIIAGLLSAMVAARRVNRIDPAAAVSGTGGMR